MRTETPVQVKLSDYSPYPFEINAVALDFDLEPAATRVRSKMTVRRVGEGAFVLDGVALTLNAISLNGQALTPEAYALNDETLTLADVPDAFELEIDVTIDPSANTVLSGLYMSGGRFCTQCESVGFRRITYWPDRPDVMSRFKVRIEGDKAAYPILLSNGTPGAAGDLEGGRHFAEWDDPHLKPSYLFALCAGDYDVYSDSFTTKSGDHVDLAVHVDKGDADRAAWAMESLKASMKWDEDVFAREYDLGVFNIVAVRDFNFGAMENKGLNVFNSAYVLADEATATDADFEAIESIVGHEYFHNWTGNRITCRDWFQLCLKEGLTVYRDQEFSADMRSRAVQRIKDVIRLRGRQFAEDAGPLAHPVRPDSYASIDNLYTATVYEKGAELIRMLKTLIGDEAFAKGMQLYFQRHDGEATTIEVFYSCFEEASGEDLSDFRRWYSQPGTPTIKVHEDWDEARSTLTVRFEQSNPKTPNNDAPKPLVTPLKVAAFRPNGEMIAEDKLVVTDTLDWAVTTDQGQPLISINRGFSAPVKIDRDIDLDVQLALTRVENDPFNQWDSFQSLMMDDLLSVAYGETDTPNLALIEALAETARGRFDDPAFAALLIRLPTIADLFQAHTPADPQALKHAQNQALQALSAALQDDIAETLAAASPTPFLPDAAQSGIRALRAAMITLLAYDQSDEGEARLKQLYDAAPNMTESLAALRALCVRGGSAKTEALASFYARWQANPLVIDKWFAVQAGTASVEEITALTSHPDYDLTNPNRVRSVIAVFAMQNLPVFHAPNGSGYRLVCEAIAQADKINPALAARLLTAFESWKSLEPQAQSHAKAALVALRDGELSENASDIVSRALD